MRQTETYVPYPGGALWACESGNSDGPAIILCSGGPGCCDYLKPVANMLDDVYRVIRFEQRGCGRSTGNGPYDLVTAVNDIDRVRQHYGVERLYVGGHSWGANLALAYAMTYPERAQALLYMAGTGVHDNRHWSETFHRNLAERGENLPEMAYPFNAEVNAEGNRTLRAFGRAPDFYARIAKLDMPALFLMAENDIRPSWPAEQLAHLMPKAKYIVIPDAAHYMWLDHAEDLRNALSEHLTKLSLKTTTLGSDDR